MRSNIHWNRLDLPGSDRCSFEISRTGCHIQGEAWFEETGVVCRYSYDVLCGADWSTRAARVSGRTGERDLSFAVERVSGSGWYLDGARLDFADDLLDIDLGFTPATNTNAIRRLALPVGGRATTTALWFDTEDRSFKRLTQVYHRTASDRYDYSSPAHGFHAELRVNEIGQVLDYPGLWSAVKG